MKKRGVCKGSLAWPSLLWKFLRSFSIPTTCLYGLKFRTPFDDELFESRGSYPGWLSPCCFNDKVRFISSELSCLAGPLLVEWENCYQTFGVICTLLLIFILQILYVLCPFNILTEMFSCVLISRTGDLYQDHSPPMCDSACYMKDCYKVQLKPSISWISLEKAEMGRRAGLSIICIFEMGRL